jgi:hypothetical protein
MLDWFLQYSTSVDSSQLRKLASYSSAPSSPSFRFVNLNQSGGLSHKINDPCSCHPTLSSDSVHLKCHSMRAKIDRIVKNAKLHQKNQHNDRSEELHKPTSSPHNFSAQHETAASTSDYRSYTPPEDREAIFPAHRRAGCGSLLARCMWTIGGRLRRSTQSIVS